MSGRVLRVTSGGLRGQELVVDGELMIGRDEQGAGGLGGDTALSRRHATLRVDANGELTVRDLGSTNGTFVNGRRIEGSQVLRAGDTLTVGTSALHVEPVAAPPPTGPPVIPASPTPAPAPAPVTVPAAAPAPPAYLATGFGGAPRRRSGLTVAAVILAVLIALAGGVAAGYAWRGSDTSTAAPPPAGPGHWLGTVYVESNTPTPNGNTVLAFHFGQGGNLNPLQIRAYPTGGSGSADLTDSGVLDADQHLWYSAERHLLFAVNQGSDSIAVFHVAGDGSLTPVAGSPFPSGGKAPASVGLSGDRLVVVNKAQDGIRDLSAVAPNYTTFVVNSDGSLQPTGSTVNAPPGYSPTQALISTSGNVVISSEEGGPFRAFTLGTDGQLTQGPNSPLPPPESLFPPGFPASKKWALGLGVHPSQPLLYAEMATVNKLAVFRYDEDARLTFLGAVPNQGGELPCWTLVNADGTRLYTDNAGNNTMTVYDISDATHPRQIQLLRLHGNGNPWDVRFDPSGRYIFMIDPRARTNVAPGQGNAIHTLVVNTDGTLSEPSYSPVPIPVPLNVNPIGIAVS